MISLYKAAIQQLKVGMWLAAAAHQLMGRRGFLRRAGRKGWVDITSALIFGDISNTAVSRARLQGKQKKFGCLNRRGTWVGAEWCRGRENSESQCRETEIYYN